MNDEKVKKISDPILPADLVTDTTSQLTDLIIREHKPTGKSVPRSNALALKSYQDQKRLFKENTPKTLFSDADNPLDNISLEQLLGSADANNKDEAA